MAPSIASILDRARRRGWTQADLAREVGWSPGRLSHYVTGRRVISLPDLEALAAAVGMEVVARRARRRRASG